MSNKSFCQIKKNPSSAIFHYMITSSMRAKPAINKSNSLLIFKHYQSPSEAEDEC